MERVRLSVLDFWQHRRCVLPEAVHGRASTTHNVLTEYVSMPSIIIEIRLTAFLLCLDMLSMIRLHSVQKLLTTCGVPNMLHTQAHALLNVSVSNNFIYDHTNGVWCDIVHDACTAVWYEFDK